MTTTPTLEHPLDAIFRPRAVAVIGASDKGGSVGRAILWNLISSPFGGTVYAINPRRRNVLGIKAYRNIGEIPEPVDLAMVLTPAPTVPGLIDKCAAAGVKAAIIISAGFAETGASGRALEEQIRERSGPGRIRIIGPNSLGVMNPVIGLNAAFATRIAKRGTVGFISQSGAVCAAILDWSLHVNVGFSAFVSFGSMVDVDWPDLIYYLGNDRNTKSIVLYVQTIGAARSFLSAVREVAMTKPIILIKPGRTDPAAEAAKATAYYTPSEACNDEVFSAAIRRSGVLRVDDIESLFAMADVLGKQPRPRGPRLAIVSNAAGPGILATDALIADGGELATLAPDSIAALDAFLPPYWNHANPVDILADADPERYARGLETVLNDPGTDGVLVVLTPQVMTDPTGTAQRIAHIAESADKPIIASWMGGEAVEEGANILNRHRIPAFPYPDAAARIFNAMWRYSYNIRGLYETATPDVEEDVVDNATAARIIAAARAEGRTELGEYVSKQVLAACGIPVVATRVAESEDEAVRMAGAIGYPVAMTYNYKPFKRRRGEAIYLNLANEADVRRAFQALREGIEGLPRGAPISVAIRAVLKAGGYRVVFASSIDPHFGPVITFGSGGPLGDLFRDRALALPPLNTTLARRTLEQTRIYTALRGMQDFKPVDTAALERLLVRFSQLVVEHRWIREIDINPFLVSADQMVALDARITLFDPDVGEDQLPRLAIRPYPGEYFATCTLKNGEEIVLRPIRPEDEAMMVTFHESLSGDTVYYRYLQQLALDERIKHERLAEICFCDYDRAMALIAVGKDPQTDGRRILAVARLVKLHEGGDADFAIVVRDDCQGVGLGMEMMRQLIHVARTEGVRRLVGIILPDNRPMLRMCAKLGFTLNKPVGGEVIAEMPL